MAIQMRRGNLADYDPDKMLPGELGVATDEDELYISFGPGNSKKVLTEDDQIEVDSYMSAVSENPVQNKAIVNALASKANLASPAFSGTPTAPTASVGTNSTQIANTRFVTRAITNDTTKIWYGTCSTASSNRDKVVTVSDSNFAVADGTLLIVNFTTQNTATGLTMNVNNTGAVKVFTYGSTSIRARFRNRTPVLFRYVADSTPHWDLVDAFINLKTEATANQVGMVAAISGRYYAVRYDSAGDLCVNVPWTDTHGSLTATDQGDGVVQLSVT